MALQLVRKGHNEPPALKLTSLQRSVMAIPHSLLVMEFKPIQGLTGIEVVLFLVRNITWLPTLVLTEAPGKSSANFAAYVKGVLACSRLSVGKRGATVQAERGGGGFGTEESPPSFVALFPPRSACTIAPSLPTECLEDAKGVLSARSYVLFGRPLKLTSSLISFVSSLFNNVTVSGLFFRFRCYFTPMGPVFSRSNVSHSSENRVEAVSNSSLVKATRYSVVVTLHFKLKVLKT